MNHVLVAACAAFALGALCVEAAAENLQVTEIQARTVKLYKSADGKGGVIDSIPKDEIEVPLNVEDQSGNKMLLVKINGKTGWIAARSVRTNEERNVKVHCSQMAGALALGPTRGLGDGKDCK